jgi:hypothetical protein
MSNIPFNPMQTVNAYGAFSIYSDGLVAGIAQDDPAIRFSLSGGILSGTETLPMWGGVAITENIPQPTYLGQDTLGGLITRATGVGTMTGLSVFNQAHHMIQSPQSPVPLAASGMSVHFHRFGSGARIAVPLAPSLVSLEGSSINSAVSWDFTNQQLVPYVAGYAANVITAASWANTNGGQSTFTTTTAHGVAVGDYFTISGMVPTGYNGDYIAQTGTTGSTLVGIATPTQQTVTPGSATTFGTLVAGGGAFPCKILRINVGNSMVVSYNATTGAASWNYAGSAAIVQI